MESKHSSISFTISKSENKEFLNLSVCKHYICFVNMLKLFGLINCEMFRQINYVMKSNIFLRETEKHNYHAERPPKIFYRIVRYIGNKI